MGSLRWNVASVIQCAAHRYFVRLFGSSVQAPPRSSLGASVLWPRVRFQSAVTGSQEAPVTFLDVCLGPACAREGVCAPSFSRSYRDREPVVVTGLSGLLQNSPPPPPRHGLFATLTVPLNWGAQAALLPCLPASLPAAPAVGAGVWCSVVGSEGSENQGEQSNGTRGSQCSCSPGLSGAEGGHAGAASRSPERGEPEKGFPGHSACVSEPRLCRKMVASCFALVQVISL